MKYNISLLMLGLLLSIVACETDDDAFGLVDYPRCDMALIFSEAEQLNAKELATTEIPAAVRTYIAAEFPGFAIGSTVSFETVTGESYLEVQTTEGGILLFDATGDFICGDESLATQSYGDDDDDDGGDDDDG